MPCEAGNQGAAQQGEVGQCVGVAGAGAVFAPDGIASPVVADLRAGPVAAQERMPLGGGALAGSQAGEVEAGFGGLSPGLGDGDLAAHDDQAAGEGEVEGLGFDGEGVEGTVFEPSVAFGGLGKKGVSGSASSLRAWSSNEG